MGISPMQHRGFKSIVEWGRKFCFVFLCVAPLLLVTLNGRVFATTCAVIGTANSPLTTATAIVTPYSVNRSTCPAGSYTDEWYKFDAVVGRKITILLTGLNQDLDIFLDDSSLNQVGISVNSGTSDDRIVYNAGYSGTYYIHIIKASISNTSPYTLVVNTEAQNSVGCNLPCTDDYYCAGAGNYCYPTEHRCRNKTPGCQNTTNCTCPPTVCDEDSDCEENPDNICTTDTCPNPYQCVRTNVICTDDGNACTSETCDPNFGCHKPIQSYGTWVYGNWGACSSTECVEGEPVSGTRTRTATCQGGCGGLGCLGEPYDEEGCEPVCPYFEPANPTHDYRSYCGDGWYKGDPNPLAIICTIVRLLNVFILSVGAIFVMFVFISAIKFALAQGDPKALQGAKQTLTMAIIGMLVVIGVFTILTIMRNIFGLKYQLTMNPFDVLSDNLAKLLERFNIYW